MSNGVLFTSTLVCRLSDRLAAADSVAGVYHADTLQTRRTGALHRVPRNR